MPAFNVADLSALEILDSRGRPTLAVTVRLADGTEARAGVPSGASTGSREAVERRDGDPDRYEGKGVLGAVASVNTEIRDLLCGRPWASLAEADQAMIDLDGTANKSRLGANATVGSSMALARALAASARTPLWQWIRPEGVTPPCRCRTSTCSTAACTRPTRWTSRSSWSPRSARRPWPKPSARAPRSTARCAASCPAARCPPGWVTRAASPRRSPSRKRSSGCSSRPSPTPAYKPGGEGVSIALDLAASEFRQPDGRYLVSGVLLSSGDMIDRLAAIAEQFPVHLIEDGLGEDDEDGWITLTARLGGTTELVGDDIFCTNPAMITRAIELGIGNSSLIKLNQIGTVTETLEAMAICRRAGYRQFVSHRSGETEDHFIADLAVGTGCGHLKTGAPARGERVAKYNRLMEIAASAPALRYGMPVG